jgi:hypothetical protein
MFWCCGKVDVIETSAPPSDMLKVDVPIVARPIVLISRAPDLENQIVVVKKEEVSVTEEADEEAHYALEQQEFTEQAIVAIFGIALFAVGTYLAMNNKIDESFYIEPVHDL